MRSAAPPGAWPWVARAVAVLAAALLWGACARDAAAPAAGAGRHLIVVAIDALRADHTGLGGYAAPTTPALDRLAAGALVLDAARAPSSFTLQSVSALMTGRLPSSGGSIGLVEAQPSEDATTLAVTLRSAGYRTALATNQPLLSGRGFTRGFDDVAVASAEAPWPCSEVVKGALAAFDSAPPGPRFLYLQLVEPHPPHDPPPAALTRFAGEAGSGGDELTARYDAEIAAADACLGALVSSLAERGELERSVLAVAGVHGNELGEHGGTGAGWTLYEEVLRVPLVLAAPGLLEPGRSAAPASLVDLGPTLLALLGVGPGDQDALDGRPLLAERGGVWRAASADDRAVVAELVIPERAVVRAVVAGERKYVAVQAGAPPAERAAVAASYFDRVGAVARGEAEPMPLWAEPAAEELYDLASDPAETRNLIAGDAAAAAPELERLRAVLDRYRARSIEHGLAARRARPRAELPSEEELRSLKSLSYL